jgi:sorting nexin-25
MQATVIHNMKEQVAEQNGGAKTKKRSKKEALQERNLKRYINQCRVAKSQCEKKIKQEGGYDYRVYGLGRGKPLQEATVEADTPKVQKSSKRRSAPSKMLTFEQIMDNSLARSYFMLFLQGNHNENLLSFWLSTEKLRLLQPPELQLAAQSVFQEFVTPSAPRLIKMDTRFVRGMEEHIYGNIGPEFFYEAQKTVYELMELRFYGDFVLSHDYTEFVCKSESAMDEIRAMLGDKDKNITSIWNDDYNIRDRKAAEALKASMPSNIEGRNDYAVRKLQLLDQNINAKIQALELSHRSILTDSREIQIIEREIEELKTERRHLEFHIERTDLWCEMLGKWKATINNAQVISINFLSF